MILSYLKIAFRNIKKHFVFSFINILGLTIGITCALLIFSFVKYELSIDSFHKDPGTIYQVFAHKNFEKNTTTPTGLAPELKKEIPEIIDYTRFHWTWGETFLSYQNTTYTENRIRFVDPSFFKIFNFPLSKGDPATALNDPNSIVISPKIAKKYFGDRNPVGQVLTMNHQHRLTVTGVLQPIRKNSSIRFDMLMPIEFNIKNRKGWYMDWNNLFPYTFIKCRKDTNTDHLSSKIAGLLNDRRGSEDAFAAVMPLKERYFAFYSDKTIVYVFISIAIFILLIACFNFMNLSTARSGGRGREIGLRKVVGASKKQMIFQFLGESMLLSLIAAILAAILYDLLLPLLNILTGREIVLNYSFHIFNSLLLALFTGLAAGIYPAFFLSNFKVIRIIKGELDSGLKGRKLRKGAVTFQFVLSIMMIISMLVVHQQTDFIQNYDIGYNKKNLVCIPMGGGSEKYYRVFKNELLKDSRIKAVSAAALELPFFNWRVGRFDWQGNDPNKKIQTSYNAVDYNFISTMEMTLIEGEDFIESRSNDTRFIINEEMAKLMGKNSLVGMTLVKGEQPGKIVGVVKNFHFNSLRNSIEPLVLQLEPQSLDNMLIRIQEGNTGAILAFIEQTWKEIIPQYPYRFSFLEDDYQANMVGLTRTGYLLSVFSILAILISCMGLFGLSSYAAARKTREIGLRKVLGASVFNIVENISREFIYLVLIANILVWPLAYYLLNNWLRQFAYHVNLSLGIFVMAGFLTLAIALLTIFYQTIKAARANPIDSLRYE
jgi:predicted permease